MKSPFIKWIFTLVLWLSYPPIFGQISLNEIVSANDNSLIVNNNSPDWIELYNDATTAVNLEGYHLSDDVDEIDKWTFPTIIIPAKSYLVVLADGADFTDEFIHTNFKISAAGEDIIFTSPTGIIIESILVPNLEKDISYGKIQEDWFFLTPTPGFPNAENSIPQLAVPTFSATTGIYSTTFDLSITHELADVEMNYFLNDLAMPIESPSIITLKIDSSTVICVKASKKGHPSSELVCHSFILEKEHQLPVLSIIADYSALFDKETGIFELGPSADANWPFWNANFWQKKATPIYFQYFNTEKTGTFKAQADLEMHGGRESRTNPQKTFRLLAKRKYNQAFFEYPFFSSKPNNTSYKRLVVRNASGDFNAGHCRDGFLQDYLIQAKLDLDANAYQPIAVYINGVYYGLMGLREKMDQYYTLSNYNTTDIDLLEVNGELLEGDSLIFQDQYQYLLGHDLSQASHFKVAADYFDIYNLTDYFLAQICNNSTAWPQNNIKYWRAKREDAKWRYLLFDMDISLGRHFWTRPAENSLLNKMTSFGDSNVFINIINAFLANESFKNYFLNRHQDLYNSVLSPAKMGPAFEAFATSIEPEMAAHLERWPTKTFERWQTTELTKIKDFIQERPPYSMQYFDEFFELNGLYPITISSNMSMAGTIDLNSLKTISTDFEGQYFKSIPITVEAKPLPNYYFSHWELKNATETISYPFNQLTKIFTEATKLKAIYRDTPPELTIEAYLLDGNTIQLKINNQSTENMSYGIFDLLGRQVANGTLSELQLGTNFIEIPIKNIINGLFIINLKQGKMQFSTKLVRIGQ